MSFGRVWRAALAVGPAVTLTDPVTGKLLRFVPGGAPLVVSEKLAKQLAGVKYRRVAFSPLPFDVTDARFIVAATPEGWGA